MSTPETPQVKLIIQDGLTRTAYKGWSRVSIHRSIHCLSGTFGLTLSPVWSGVPRSLMPGPGQLCELSIGDRVVITGFIDTVSELIDKNQHTLTVTGRDKVADLVDCSSLIQSRTRQNVKLVDILDIIEEEFKVPFKIQADTGSPFPAWSIGDESVFDNLARTAALRELMVITDGLGTLVVTKPNSSQPRLVLNKDSQILSIQRTQDHLNRYSYYETRSQSFVETQGKDVHLKVLAKVRDPSVKRYRPTLVQQDGEVVERIAKKRLHWEVATRKAKSDRVTLQLASWLNQERKLWNINETVQLDLPMVTGPYLITSVNFVLDNNGTKTHLELEALHSADIDPTLAAREYDQKKAVDEDHLKLGGTP